MPNGMAVTRMTAMNSNPAKTWLTAGSGTEKPKLANDWDTLARFMPP